MEWELGVELGGAMIGGPSWLLGICCIRSEADVATGVPVEDGGAIFGGPILAGGPIP